MRSSRSKKRTRSSRSSTNDTSYAYSTKLSRIEDEGDEESNHSSSTTNTSTSKYQTRASRKPSYRIGITIERKKTRKSRRKGAESEEEDYYVDNEYEAPIIPSDVSNNSDDDVDDFEAEEEIEEEEEVVESEEDDAACSKKRLRPAREAPALFLDDAEIPELKLPASSEDLLIAGKEMMRALSIYEILRHFQNTLRLTPFRFEDFCVALLIDEQTYLLSEIHIQLLKALIREDDLVGTQHGPQDLRDSISIYLYLCDHMTWPEVMRIWFSSDLKKNSRIISDYLDVNYPFSSIENKLNLLEHLCEEFLNSASSREVLNNEGVIKHEDNCRVCHRPGDLLCCETCPAVFHLNCLDPPLKQVPTEEWLCPICKLNSVTGVTDCMNEFEKQGYLSRQEPVGWDRHGRNYWFLCRRLIVEDRKEDGNICYYSSRLQFDELLSSLDEENYEKDLCAALEEIKEDIYRQMSITEKLTKTAKGQRKSYLEVVNEELFIKRSARLKLESENGEHNIANNNNSGGDEKYAELESKLAVDDDDLRGGVQTRLKTGSLQPKSVTLDPFKNRVNVYNSINTFREDDSVIIVQESGTLSRTTRKALPANFWQMNLFKLGLEGNYRQYQNIFSVNQYALNKFQQADERDKKRHLSHKFSLTQASELKWASYTQISTAIATTSMHGSKHVMINILRQALLYLETQFSQNFMHPNWHVHRNNWIKAVSMCAEPKEFSLALHILESSMKPVLFNSAWHETLGFSGLQKSTQLERDELKKKDKKRDRGGGSGGSGATGAVAVDPNETIALDGGDANTSRYYGAGVGVRLVFGKLKHQIWKQKGEEYRLSGIGGWHWLTSTRVKPESTCEINIENEWEPPECDFVESSVIDISQELQKSDISMRNVYPKIYKATKLDSLLKSRLEMHKLEKKRQTSLGKSNLNGSSFVGHPCYSACCTSAKATQCYSPLCLSKSSKNNSEDKEETYDDTCEHVDLLQVTLVDNVPHFSKKTIPFNSKGQLPPSSRFSIGKYKSILILPSHEMRKLGRNGGLREVTGFSYNSKINNTVWPYGQTPRPYFRTIWLLRTHYLNNLHSAALQLRVFWAAIRWDDLSMKPPVSGTNTITTDSEVQTIEILKRRDLPPFGLRSEYLIRKIIVPIDLPVRQREVSTPNRSGLRERRRPESPQVKGPRMEEIWINEEEIELWEIRQFGEKAEKQIQLAKQRAAQEEKARQAEILRKKNEEHKKLANESKMLNGTLNVNPAKSITSRFTNLFQNRPVSKILGSSPLSVSSAGTFQGANVATYATIRTANGTFKIPVQNKPATQQLILRPGTQILTATSSQPTIINSVNTTTTVGARPGTATYIVRTPNVASNRPIIITNSALNGSIIRPNTNIIQTNIKQGIPLITANTPQKISTGTTVNAILTGTPTKTIAASQVGTPTTPAMNPVGTKNIQCVQLKTQDGRTHLVPISSLTGANQTFQFAVNSNSSTPLRILTKPAENSTAKDSQGKPILVAGNPLLGQNTFILSNIGNQKVLLQPSTSLAQTTTVTAQSTVALGTAKGEVTKANAKPVVAVAKEPVSKVVTSAPTNALLSPPKPTAVEEKEFVLTAEMTQEIVRKALMDSSLAPETSQKLMAYQRHHQEMFDHNTAPSSSKSPVKTYSSIPSSSNVNSSGRLTSRSSRYSRNSRYDSEDFITDFPKSERKERSDEDDVTRACRGALKYIVDKIDKEERRIKQKEFAEERRQKRAVQQKLKYRQNHIELLRRSILRRKAKLNTTIKTRAEGQFKSKLPPALLKQTIPKITIAPITANASPVAVPVSTKRKLDEQVLVSPSGNDVKPELPNFTTSTPIHNSESKPKRARVTVTPSVNNLASPKKPPSSKISPKSRSKQQELYCICRKPNDHTYMIGCDSCSDWFHPVCVGLDHLAIGEIDSYTCPRCKSQPASSSVNASAAVNNVSFDLASSGLNNNHTPVRSSTPKRRAPGSSRPPKKSSSRPLIGDANSSSLANSSSESANQNDLDDSLYCVCRKMYDPAQFYICCDRCQDWYHGRCVGITSAEAESIAEYICPRCEGDNSINYRNIKDLSEDDYAALLRLHKTIQVRLQCPLQAKETYSLFLPTLPGTQSCLALLEGGR